MVPVLRAALKQRPERQNLVRRGWDSLAVFDLAKAERAAGGSNIDYLGQLARAISIDASNNLAKRAFVDAVAQNAVSSYAGDARRYLRDLARSNEMKPDLVLKTAAALHRASQ